MFAFSLDNLLFLLLIAVAGLFQLLSKTLGKSGKSDSSETSSSPKPQTPRPVQRTPRESDADRIRKFLEALGQPPSSTPPPPPARPLAPVQPPPVIIPRGLRLPQERRQKTDVTQEESQSSQPRRRFHEIIPPPEPLPIASTFEVHETLPVELQQPPSITAPVEIYASSKASGVAKREDFKMDIATLLRSKSTLKEVILLREILGTPRGLQSVDVML